MLLSSIINEIAWVKFKTKQKHQLMSASESKPNVPTENSCIF